MKKSSLIHLVWALVAIAAYAFGSKFTGNSGSTAQEEETANPSNRSLSSRSSNANGNISSANGSNSQGSRRSNSQDSSSTTPLSENEIRQLGAHFKSAKGPIERRLIFSQILENLTVENAELMREQILHLKDNSTEFREFHYAWGSIAGEEAVDFGATSPELDRSAAFSGWASSSPEAALAFFNSLSEEQRSRSSLKWGAITGLTNADPNLAVRFALDMQEAGDRDGRRLMDSVTRQVLRSGNTADAASWASALPSGPAQDAAVKQVAREYADENPTASLAWANTLPSGDAKNTALWNSYSEWARQDPTAAAQRLETMSASPERDAATYGYANRIANKDPQTAVEWASTISDQKTRTRALIDTGRSFFRRSPDAAREWLTNSGLSPAQQQSITNRKRG